MGPTAESQKNIHRQNQMKPCGSWRYIEVLRHKMISLCKKLNSIYIIFYLWSTAMSNCPERVHNIQRVTHQREFIITSRRVSFGFCLCMFFFTLSCVSHWLPLYDWQTATVWPKSPTSRMPWDKQINIKFSFLGELSL